MAGKDSGHTSFSPDIIPPPLKLSWITERGFMDTYPPPGVIVSDNIVYTRDVLLNGSEFETGTGARATVNGSLIWRFSGASPAVAYHDYLYAWNNESVISLKNGMEVWRQPVTGPNSPILYKDLLIAGNVTAFHHHNGSVIWTYHPQLLVQETRHTRIDSYLPLTAGNETVILAINSMESELADAGSGSGASTAGDSRTAFAYKSSPDEQSCTLIALDAASGKERWIQKIPILSGSAPVISGDRVFIGGNATVRSFWLNDGSEIWRAALPGYSRTLSADPEFLIVDDRFGHNVTALRLEDGKTEWIYESEGRSRSMSIAGPVLYIVGTMPSAGLVALDIKTGTPIWEKEMPADWTSISSQPVISGDTLYITTMTGKTYAFSPAPQDQNPRPNPLPSSEIVLSITALICIYAVTRRES
ncbi:PQQ-binding-like beta-propeller repeat protein [Methanoregula sp.]|uniref:PQQ-binding-like beta-propeller repeat protein n=1 Tax=Methanoregula sp. TaxID=2052170 RepID=UPI00356A1C6C